MKGGEAARGLRVEEGGAMRLDYPPWFTVVPENLDPSCKYGNEPGRMFVEHWRGMTR